MQALLPASILNTSQRLLTFHIVFRPVFAGGLNTSAMLVVFNSTQRFLSFMTQHKVVLFYSPE